MMLDANSFKTQLTPEVAIGIIQKAAASRGWKKIEIQQIRLVYTPYYVFSFDVSPEGAQPVSGKTALNAFSGELNDFVPVLLERPLTKTRDTGDAQCEVEPTSISQSEAKEAAQAKVGAQLGVKRDFVAISAVSKFYAPAFRVWVNVADDQFKIDVDACLGAPSGMDAIPARQKGWDEATAETIEKMKSPAGWVDLAGKAVSGAGKAGGTAKGPAPKPVIWILLILAVIAFFALGLFGGGKNNENKCMLDKAFIEEKTVWLFSKEISIKPREFKTENGTAKFVEGTCHLLNTARSEQRLCLRTIIFAGKDLVRATNYTDAFAPAFDAKLNQTIVKNFRLEWQPMQKDEQYSFKHEPC